MKIVGWIGLVGVFLFVALAWFKPDPMSAALGVWLGFFWGRCWERDWMPWSRAAAKGRKS